MAELYACLYRPPVPTAPQGPAGSLAAIAQEFSPRYECHQDDFVTIDVSGLERLIGTPETIAAELDRTARAYNVDVHVALARRRSTARVLAYARPGITVVAPGNERSALAPVRIEWLETLGAEAAIVHTLKSWGLQTFGELAALPRADLLARLGRQGCRWQAIARADDEWPLVPDQPDDRFEASLELEWPVEGIEPLSFVLTRLLEPLSLGLEMRDRGAAALQVSLRLVTRSQGTARDTHVRRLELPSPIRDVRTLRTIALLDLESHPPAAAVDAVTITIEPTPARILQHTLFTPARPTPDTLATLLARLYALMGQDRVGAPVAVDSYRPGAFAVKPFAIEHASDASDPPCDAPCTSALHRCRGPVPARVVLEHGRPVRVSSDRQGFPGGRVTACAGPWRTSGQWWATGAGRAGRPGTAGRERPRPHRAEAMESRGGAGGWDWAEWEVAVSDGAVYRIFHDRETHGWFIDAIVD